eukprot:5301729-Pleurochrysis_carterae.AAC.1
MKSKKVGKIMSSAGCALFNRHVQQIAEKTVLVRVREFLGEAFKALASGGSFAARELRALRVAWPGRRR